MQISNEQLLHIESFIGYGTTKADYWFLGMEEGGGGDDNIRARLKFQNIEDCKNAHQILGITEYHSGKRKIQRTWRGMCYTMLKIEGKEPTRELIRNYQANELGRTTGNTFLCELMPLPKPNMGSWEYDDLIPQYKSRKDYYDKVKPVRINLLKNLFSQENPKVIVAYGKKFWNDYRKIFDNVEFQKVDNFLVGMQKTTKIILTDHFVSRTMNRKFDTLAYLMNSK